MSFMFKSRKHYLLYFSAKQNFLFKIMNVECIYYYYY